MRHIPVFILFVLMICLSCNEERTNKLNSKKKWIYVELEVMKNSDTTDYHYYGQVYQTLLDNLADNENFKTLFMLSNVRYIGDDSELKIYEDHDYKGTLFFRTEDIVKIEILKDDPLRSSKRKQSIDSITSED